MKKYLVKQTTKNLNISALNDILHVSIYTFIKEILRREMVSDIMGHPVRYTILIRFGHIVE